MYIHSSTAVSVARTMTSRDVTSRHLSSFVFHNDDNVVYAKNELISRAGSEQCDLMSIVELLMLNLSVTSARPLTVLYLSLELLVLKLNNAALNCMVLQDISTLKKDLMAE